MGKTLKHIPREHLDQVEWNLEANNGGTSVTVNDFPGGGSGDLNSKIVNGFIGSHQVHESNLQTAMKLLLGEEHVAAGREGARPRSLNSEESSGQVRLDRLRWRICFRIKLCNMQIQ